MLGAGGAFRLTPLYDVISAYPVIGRGANQLAPQRVTMARQWGIDPQAATQAMVEMVTATTDVMAEVTSTIPAGFPSSVADPILGGLEDAAQRLSKALDLGTKTEESLSSTPDT